MKLIDFLKVMDKDTFICVVVEAFGMHLEAKHSAKFLIDSADSELHNKKIMKAYVADGCLRVLLED